MNQEIDQNKLQELQMLEQQLQSFLMQKQQIQIELNEINNALDELSKTDDEVYRVVGEIMLKSDKDTLSKELGEKKKLADLRLGAIEKQESNLDKKAGEIRQEFTKTLEEKSSQDKGE